ncbi:hypothetical protein NE237_020271 [Protea cynaroides]|uniref:Uncharacterized protein n=1 Tax=Protea cynaroides TaxID=273540 RepID=A0A9Q0K257_9MAGN|nr:hypothetical protein NE237_020271 [Protea cynaroides]
MDESQAETSFQNLGLEFASKSDPIIPLDQPLASHSGDNNEKDQNDPPGLEEVAGREQEDNLVKEPTADSVEGNTSQIRPEENWIPIRVKKKRSGGPVGGLNHTKNPTHDLNLQYTFQSKKLPLNHVSSAGKLHFSGSNLKFPSQKANFHSGATNPLAAVCAESEVCPPNRFECLNSVEDQSVQAESDGPPDLSVLHHTPDPAEPHVAPNESISPLHLSSPSNSAGHTPFPPRRPSFLKRGVLSSHIDPRNSVEPKPGAASTRAQFDETPSSLGPIAPPSSSLTSNKSLFDHMKAAVRHNHAGIVAQPIGPLMNKKPPADCTESKEKGRTVKGQDGNDQRRMKIGNNVDLYGKKDRNY